MKQDRISQTQTDRIYARSGEYINGSR